MSTTNTNAAPIFDQDLYRVTIPSVVGIGLILTTLDAQDADASDTLTYSIIDGNDGGLFGIDAVTGAITVADVGVRSEFTSYTLTVQVTDSSGRTDTAELVLANQILPGRGSDGKDSLYAHEGEIGEIGYAYGARDTVYGSKTFPGTMYGGSGNDTMYSQNPGYVFYGGSGFDYLSVADVFVGKDVFYGGSGVDYLFSGGGDDFLDGGDDSDVLNGGAGADTFVLDTNDSGSDVIRFFNPSEGDKIRIEVTDPTISTLEELFVHADLRVATENVDTLRFESFLPETIAQINHVKFPFTNDATILDTAIYKVVGEVDRISGGDDELVLVLMDFDAPLTYSMFDVVLSILDSETYSASLSEAAAMDSAVVQVTAINPSTSLNYAIIGGNDAGLFSIDNTGQITLIGALDYEMATHHIIAVRVTDGEGRTDMAEVVINVLDVNEHAPIFGAATYDAEIAENAVSGTAVVQAVATDADANERLNYAITSGDDARLFSIDSNGQITLIGALDYETATSYTLTIQVTDRGGRTDTAEVIVAVTNVNDESPVFGADVYNTIVAENAARDTLVVQIDATDADANDTQNYAITGGNDARLFSINADTGAITLTGALDYETATSHTLDVQVTDSGGRTDTAEVVVGVLNVNEHAPIFNLPVDEALISENAAIGTAIIQVAARDGDLGDTLRYSITSGNDDGLFSINANSGQITLIGALDYETATSHTLGVLATDSGGLTGTADVVIDVLNVNEHAPVFDVAVQNQFVSESTPIGTTLPRIVATDADAGDTLDYEIVSGNDDGLFSINEDSGQMTLIGALDYETATRHTLTIQVTDSGGLTDMADIVVNVLNVNEYEPVFRRDVYNVEVAEDAATDTALIRVAATDRDAGDTLRYAITSGNDDRLFDIDAVSGQITLIGALDYETATSHTLGVLVTDSANRLDTAEVIVTVADVDEGNVFFNRDIYLFPDIPETATTGYAIGGVSATDVDGDALVYSIFAGNDAGLFSIDAASGVVTIAAPNQITSPDTIAMTLLAEDSDGNFDKVTVTVQDSATRGTSGGDTIRGSGAIDIIYGGGGADRLIGRGNADHLYGEAGDDTLNGGRGDDVLSGGMGLDVLEGRRGDDVFVLNGAGGENDGDVVIDFRDNGGDTIRVDVADPSAITRLADLASSANLRLAEGHIRLANFSSDSDDASQMNTAIYHTNGTLRDTSDDIVLMVLEDFTGLDLNMMDII